MDFKAVFSIWLTIIVTFRGRIVIKLGLQTGGSGFRAEVLQSRVHSTSWE